MVSASSDKPAIEIDRTAFKDELKRSVLLDINCQSIDTSESGTADIYKAHLVLLNKRLEYNGCDAVYTAYIIGQCLSELKQIYHGNKKLFIYTTKHMFTISFVYFFVDLCDLATTYYTVSRMSCALKDSSKQIQTN